MYSTGIRAQIARKPLNNLMVLMEELTVHQLLKVKAQLEQIEQMAKQKLERQKYDSNQS